MATNVRSVTAYALVVPTGPLDIRAVGGYVLQKAQDPLSIRAVGGYLMVAQITYPVFPLSGLAGLLAAINKEQGTSFTQAQLTFANPGPLPDSYFNTQVKLTATSSNPYRGEFTFSYHRFELKDAFQGKPLTLPSNKGSTVHLSLPGINSQFNLTLEARDVVDAPVAANATGITLTTTANSYYFLPNTSVVLGTV